ncbi:cysteine--tRNA ligase [Levilactobacillus spicheri]|uniref:Cysteine--tRNA ligase n=2 Tax=Levilactobacillus spicheri TaxID=216463 RepID=A0A0F3RW86_9LACO|nr:cysteine--tRNA ligase [Levilactobacillus spicheri]KJW13047.1 cysteinyl-tRNA synthetase [Levilactobacillus spicheri]KRL48440.1 cysteinyl-tRNA synthetase [Levilactobacillus spicheri DSM 15429]GEO67088.1 cysteine--tRNA ligase [Levilactobacillus spicheri]
MLKVFNTMTRQKETFEPMTPGVVNMYVCGPTVYNYIHIGNARSVIAFDTIRRYFEYRGYQVKYVSNFTDVDDKMIREAHKEGITVPELGDKFIQAFKEDTAALNIEPATANPRATDFIQEIVSFIEKLITKGYAYPVDGDVYYRAHKFADYGKLSHQNIDELEEGASQHTNDEETARKEDPIDFALWKGAKPGEISWPSPWGAGRPGWHIECSVMSTHFLGDTFDIHGGGEDLTFPHHENEIAQSEAETGKPFVHYWMHNGFVTVGDENQKMSKSLGNFVTVHDLIKTVDPQTLRFFMATTQYRRPIQYTQQNIDTAARNLQRLQTAYDNMGYRLKDAEAGNDPKTEQETRQLVADYIDAMDDDFNVQNGVSKVYDLARLGNVYAERSFVLKGTLEFMRQTLADLLGVFGVVLTEADSLDDDHIQSLIDERIQARQDRNFQRSDEIREQLKNQGIILEDTPQGTRWRKEN